MSSSPARIGLIGCGNIWRAVYHPILDSLKGRVRITAFCDPSDSAADFTAQLLPAAKRYADADTLFREEKLDAAIVLTSETANAATALSAIRSGLAVYLEKPPATSALEWRQLTAVANGEAASNGGQIYTAFNRRHTPLFKKWRLSPDVHLRTVRGVLHRQGRPVETYPYTAVHLIDSVQFFSGRLLTETTCTFSEGEHGLYWKVQGYFEDGAACELIFIPNSSHHSEAIVFEAMDQKWELYFPNSPSKEHPDGLLRSRSLVQEQDIDCARGEPEADPLEAMGHAPCFRDFLDRLENNDWEASPHSLRQSEFTVGILEKMLESVASSQIRSC